MLSFNVTKLNKKFLIKDVSKDYKKITLFGNYGKDSIYFRNEILLEIKKNNNEEYLTLKSEIYHKRVQSLIPSYIKFIENVFYDLDYGFFVFLEVRGVGFKVVHENGVLTFNLGYSHKTTYTLPENVVAKILDDKNTLFYILGYNRQKVLSTASEICLLKNRDPYKGKGVFIFGERFKLKEGKSKKKG